MHNPEDVLISHLSQQTLINYLDGALGDTARGAVWQHLQDCTRCARRLRDESALRSDLNGELRAMNAARPRDLGAMLPGIISEARQPTPRRVKRSAALLIVALVIVTALPFLRNAESVSTQTPFENEPRATLTYNQRAGHFVNEETSTPFSREISLKYASPAPLPQATLAASAQPAN